MSLDATALDATQQPKPRTRSRRKRDLSDDAHDGRPLVPVGEPVTLDEKHHGDQKEPAEAGTSDWGEPVPFGSLEVPPFPVDKLPRGLREWVAAEAEATQTPPDLAAFCALGTVAAAAQKRAQAEVRPGWREALGLYLVSVAAPGSRKSAVFSDATRPLVEVEAEAMRRVAPEVTTAKALREVAEQRLKDAQRKAAKGSALDGEALVRAAVDALERVKIPMLPRWIVDDATPEALVGAMKDAGGRIAIMSAEGGTFDIMGGRYSEGRANLDVYLHGHAGEAVRVQRVGRQAEQIRAATMTLCLAVQPAALAAIEAHRGRGLPARFLYAVPDDLVGRRRDDAPPVPTAVAETYRAIIRGIAELPEKHDEDGELVPHTIPFNAKARAAFEAYHDHIEPRLAGDLAWIADWGSKLRGALARVATLFAVVDAAREERGWPAAVDERNARYALALAPYLIAHARAAFGEMGADPALDAARRALSWLERGRSESVITVREVQRGAFGGRGRADVVREALRVLAERGYVRDAGGDRFEVHPVL